jgi:hypothetical protein
MLRNENGSVYYKMGGNLINGDTWSPDSYHWEGKTLTPDGT